MSGAAPVVEDALKAASLRSSTHGGADGLSVADDVNPLSRVRRPATALPENEHERSEHNSDFDEHARMNHNPMHSGARGSDIGQIPAEHMGLPDHEPTSALSSPTSGGGILGGVRRMFSSAASTATGLASTAWSGTKGLASSSWSGAKRLASGAKKIALGVPGAISRGFQGLRSGIKGNADDYSSAVNTVASHTVDPLMDKIATKKSDLVVDSQSWGWKSRA
jgi:hypothetical protein